MGFAREVSIGAYDDAIVAGIGLDLALILHIHAGGGDGAVLEDRHLSE